MTTENLFKIIDLDSNGPSGIYMVMNPEGLSCLNVYVPEGKEIDENITFPCLVSVILSWADNGKPTLSLTVLKTNKFLNSFMALKHAGTVHKSIDLVDLLDAYARMRMHVVHPGVVLKRDFLAPLGITGSELADAMGVSEATVSNILNCQTDISINTAARPGIALDTGHEYWINLQASYNKTREDDNASPKAARKVTALK